MLPMLRKMTWKSVVLTLLAVSLHAQQYDLLIRGGHVIDPKNKVDAVADVAIAGGKIALVAPSIPAERAKRIVNASGLLVTPGLIDIHAHLYAGTGMKGVLTGDASVYPDTFSFRTGLTTMVDAGTSGWRNFADFRQRVIDRAQTRVLAFVNIVGYGMSTAPESDPADMLPEPAAEVARKNADVVVGFKTAHYTGKGWPAVEGAVKAGELTHLPVMVDFGFLNEERNIRALFLDKLRPGDIYTHCYSGHREEVLDNGTLNPAMEAGRKRGIIFDVGHGGGSFYWNVAVPATRAGFWPDSISTDLHTGSMNAGMKDFTETMSKILILGAPLQKVIEMSTWNPAKEIHHEELGHLSPGAVADVTLLRLEEGQFGFLDCAGARLDGTRRFLAEVTIKGGEVMWDRNGRAAQDWKSFHYTKREAPPTK
jgi:dihydroorotase